MTVPQRLPSGCASAPPTPDAAHFAADALPLPGDWHAYLSRHGRSFWLAAQLIPQPQRDKVAAVYAYCRYTDDLVDGGLGSRDQLLRRLDCWEALSRKAYAGWRTGVALLDTVMAEMAGEGVPFEYAAALLRGMRQDALGTRFASLGDLQEYCFNVASVVGLWLTTLFGPRDAWTLARASDLGMAMQLTNIARDVGEDWARGRLYLPSDLLDAHGVDAAVIERLRTTSMPVPARYAEALEELMRTAEGLYGRADEAIANLPPFFRPAVAVASRVYRSIHDAIRANGYDNVRKRAMTSDRRKLQLAREALGLHGAVSVGS